MAIRQDIERSMERVTLGEGRVQAELCFDSGFTGFQGHFPQQPVLPGMCLLEVVRILAERLRGESLRMQELVVAKFFSIVQPDQTIQVDCRVDGDTVQAHVTTGEQRIAQVKMKVTYA